MHWCTDDLFAVEPKSEYGVYNALRVVADFDHKIELSDVCSDEFASMGCGVFSCLNRILGIFIIYFDRNSVAS